MQNRNAALTLTNDDLNNLLASVNIAIVMLGSDLRIRRFTPVAGRILNLIPSDLGRPFTDIRHGIQGPDFSRIIAEVTDTVTLKELEVTDQHGRWYSLAVRPYRTSDHRIDGAVLTLVDIDELKRRLEQAREARDFAKVIIETAAEPLVVLDRELRIRTANAAFCELFRIPQEQVEGKPILETAASSPALHALLDRVAQGGPPVLDQEVVEDSPDGRRTLLVSTRAIERDGRHGSILLGLRDITASRVAEPEVAA
ncbi:MAG: PAS domain-containing protein [Acidobacteriota bacterium]